MPRLASHHRALSRQSQLSRHCDMKILPGGSLRIAFRLGTKPDVRAWARGGLHDALESGDCEPNLTVLSVTAAPW